MAFTLVTISGGATGFRNEDGSVAKGTIVFVATAEMANGGEIRAATAVVASLDNAGQPKIGGQGGTAVILPATDDAGTLPSGVTYWVYESIQGASDRRWSLAIPHTSGTLDLSTVAPALAPNAAYAYALDAQIVHLAGTETITGPKTFSVAPAVPDASFAESKVIGLGTDLAARALDSTVVHLAGAEPITGVKTFSANPIFNNAAIPDAALSSNINLLNAIQTVTALKTMSGGITGLPVPTLASDAATKSYADGLIQGLSIKASVKAASSSNVASLSGPKTIDSYSAVVGDRVLLFGQSTASQNGIWVVQSGAWTRPTDFATGSEAAGSFVFVEAGTVNGGSGYTVATVPPVTVDSTAQSWTQFSGAGEITAGTGLSKSGNTLSNTGVLGTSAADGTIVQGGTAANPTFRVGAIGESLVTGLTADLASTVHLAGIETISGLKTFSALLTATGGIAASTLMPKGAPYFDVTHPDFGADKTGVADSSAAFQAANDAAHAQAIGGNSPKGGGTVFVPDGQYKVQRVAWSPYVSWVGTSRIGTQSSRTRLVGANPGISNESVGTLTTTIANGAAGVVSLAVSGGLLVKVPQGMKLTLNDGSGHALDVSASATTAAGATSIAVYSFTNGSGFDFTANTATITQPQVIFCFDGHASNVYASVERLEFDYGYDAIGAYNGLIALTMEDVSFVQQGGSGIHGKGGMEQLYWNRVLISSGGGTGWLVDGYGVSQPATNFPYLDKSTFTNVELNGNLVGANVQFKNGTCVNFRNLKLIRNTQDGFIFGGGLREWTMLQISAEGNGYLGGVGTANPTTGTISSGTTALTVGANSGMVVDASGATLGSRLTVAGAGVNGADLYTNISAIAGTAITVTVAASTTVTNADTTWYPYSDVKLINPSAPVGPASPANITFIDCQLGTIALSQGGVRYAVDLSAAGAACSWIGGATANRPIYDPLKMLATAPGSSVAVRRLVTTANESAFTGSSFSTGNTDDARMVSAAGKNLVLGLVDSLQNQTGTFGQFEFRHGNGGHTRIGYITSTNVTPNYSLNLRGAMGIGGDSALATQRGFNNLLALTAASTEASAFYHGSLLTAAANADKLAAYRASGTFADAGKTNVKHYAFYSDSGGDISFDASLIFSAAAGKIIPGATSISHRNNADSADNILIADNGDTTFRARVLMATAASKIVPGATSLSLRNNADSADNWILTDAGDATLRGSLTLSDTKNVVLATGTGSQIGTAIGQKLAFYGATPIAQRAGAAQVAIATTASTQTTPWGFSTQAQADAIVTLANELRAAGVAIGLIKGAA